MSAALIVRHARAIGACASRGEVEHWLGGVPVEALGLAADEILYVPRVRARVPPGRGQARIADQILGTLRAELAGADSQILGTLRAELAGADSGWGERFVPGRAYRFRNRPAYCAWLIGLWVHSPSTEARAAFAAATGETSLARWQRKMVLGDGPLLVATVMRLAEIGLAAHWIATLEPGDVAVAAPAIATAFGVNLELLATSPPPPAANRPFATGAAARHAHETVEQADIQLTAHGNVWRDLPPPNRTLLLAAATLAHAPSRSAGRTAVLAAAIVAHAASTVPAAPSFFDLAAPVISLLPTPPAPTGHPPTARSIADAPAAYLMKAPGAQPRPHISTAQKAASVAPSADQRPQSRIKTPKQVKADTHVPPVAPVTPPDPIAASHPLPLPAITQSILPDAAFSTGYGGLLFLLNAFVALGLYPDFTQPNGPRLDPSPLWLADRIGRYRFGARYARDPLARWCSAHAAGGTLPATWRVPNDWLDGFATARSPGIVRRRNRITLWHPDGFPLHDAARYRPPTRARPLARPPHRLPRAPSDRWAACLALYLDARLRRMTGAGLELLVRPARIRLYDLDLSASFDLARHPIELRLAGLDRNPGWQPAEGRGIAFDFA